MYGPSASTDVKAWLSCRVRMSQNLCAATKDGTLWGEQHLPRPQWAAPLDSERLPVGQTRQMIDRLAAFL